MESIVSILTNGPYAQRRTRTAERVCSCPKNEEEAAVRIEDASDEARLTPKEKEVVALVLKRRTNAEITGKLYISLYTAKNHVSSILRKLDLKSRRELS